MKGVYDFILRGRDAQRERLYKIDKLVDRYDDETRRDEQELREALAADFSSTAASAVEDRVDVAMGSNETVLSAALVHLVMALDAMARAADADPSRDHIAQVLTEELPPGLAKSVSEWLDGIA